MNEIEKLLEPLNLRAPLKAKDNHSLTNILIK